MNATKQPIDSVDPEWAWSAFQPSKESPWDTAAAAHLFRRAGFTANTSTIETALEKPLARVIDRLLDVESEPTEFRNSIDSLIRAALATGNAKRLSAQWVYRMIHTPVPLLEKTTLFWHGHFATSAEKVDDAQLMQDQNNLLRTHAVGDFNKLLLEISRDPAMLIYLDSASNRKLHPNENYAREIMELFCLGEGNYSEQDVRQLARCFTGWEIKRKKFRFNKYQHDRGEKQVLGQTGAFTGDEGVAIVAKQEHGPQFIAGKLIRFFVMDEPTASNSLIKPLADELRANDFQIRPTIKRILASNLFFSEHARARKIRSPVEFAVGFLRGLDASTDCYVLSDALQRLGQGLYYPPSVKGWDGGRTWINSSTLLGRANLIRQLLDNGRTRFGQTTLTEYLDRYNVRSAVQLADWIQPLLFAMPVNASVHERAKEIDSAGGVLEQRLKDAVHLMCSLPEFQLA